MVNDARSTCNNRSKEQNTMSEQNIKRDVSTNYNGGGGGGGSGGDDMRVSKIIRRLLNEDSISIWLDLSKKLEAAIRMPSNISYIRRSFEGLLDNMLLVLKKCPASCSLQISNTFGAMAYIGRSSFPAYEAFLLKNYRNNKRLQKKLVLALKSTLSCDSTNLELDVYSEGIMQVLKEILENIETGEMFIVISSATVVFAKNYTYTFDLHFMDVIDIIIGWHLESKESVQVREHCAYILKEFSPFFDNKLSFTLGLLSQFIEDISVLNDEMSSELTNVSNSNKSSNGSDNDNGDATALERVSGFIGAFNSLLKCLLQSNNSSFIETTLYETVAVALKILTKIFLQLIGSSKNSEPISETITAINELFSICLISGIHIADMAMMQQIIEMQLLQLTRFNNEHQQLSAIFLVLSFVRRQRTSLPVNFVCLIFEVAPKHKNMLNTNDCTYGIWLRIYQEILLIKNVPILQEAYKCLTQSIDNCIATILNDTSKTDITAPKFIQAESQLNFNLTALSALATQTSSIIAMYACKPSILELLITNCRANEFTAWSYNPTLHNSILELLVAHCRINHNYRNTSRLWKDSTNSTTTNISDHTSPTAENFSTILQFLASSLEKANSMNLELLKVLLRWTLFLLQGCKDGADVLITNKNFLNICKIIGSNAVVQLAPLECGACIEILMCYNILSHEILNLFRNSAYQQLDNCNAKIHATFANIYATLPLSVTLGSKCPNFVRLDELTFSYRASKRKVVIRDRFFKLFLETIQNETEPEKLSEMLRLCYAERIFDVHDKRIEKFFQQANKSSRLLSTWLQFELARYLVEQKLRTPVGKPQETFLAIEAIIMRYARLMSSPKDTTNNENSDALLRSLSTHRNMRFLMGFIDCLEKLIYNAVEGTAFAFHPPEKPARSFFRLNTTTCHSWFNRIRPGIILLAMHIMEPETVIRYSEEMLLTLKPQDAPFDQTIVYLTWALLNCNESDTLEGMYLWVRAKTNKRYQWIQYAADQAAGRKELAIAGYRTLLNDTDMDGTVRQFIVAQLQDCLYHTAQWTNLKTFQQKFLTEDADSFNPFTQRKNSDISKMESLLAKYDPILNSKELLNNVMQDLSIWPDEHELNDPASINVNRHLHQNFEETLEDLCLDRIITKHNEKFILPSTVEQILNISWSDALLSTSSANMKRINLTLLKNIAEKLSSGHDLTAVAPELCGNLDIDAKRRDSTAMYCSSTILIKCCGWTELIETHANTKILNSLYLDIASISRREGNYKCTQSMLERFFQRRNYTAPLPDITAQLLNDRKYMLDTSDNELLRGYSEIAKWLYVHEKPNEMESINLGAALCLRIHEQVSNVANETNTPSNSIYPVVSSDMLLTLAEWLTQRSANNVTPCSAIVKHLLDVLPDLSLLATAHSVPDTDKIIGRLINASIIQQEQCEDAWLAYGNWCYRWGKKIVEARSNDNSSLLSSQHIAQIKTAIGDEGATLDNQVISKLVSTLNKYANDNAEDTEPHDDYNSSTELLKGNLRDFSILKHKSPEVIDHIISIWQQASKNLYEFYEASARAYFRYLNLKSPNSDSPEQQHRYHVDDSNMVTITLRLLRLIVKHAFGLQDVFEDGLKTTPIQPWKVIIPQLFSRLNHHESYVRKSVSDLLCRLSEKRPHLVIFPAVVGANRELKSQKLNQSSEATTASMQLTNCFGSLLGTLAKQSPQTVLHVQLLVKELKRVCLLWDEYWIHSLAHIYNNYLPRITTLENEFQIDDIESKTKKFDTFRHQIVSDLQKVVDMTSRDAETDYERTFKARFDENIRQTIDDLRTKNHPEAWNQLKHLYNIFQQNPIRGCSATLQMCNLSPVLANMSNTIISMPGVDLYEGEPIYIRAVESTLRILPTKTKPKKVAFHGSNGQRYTYLFKGLEDLHLDERIMQFLSISNSIMACKKDVLPSRTCYKAHHYSVIPLGPQSGLISWVDGVTPLFTVYKKWQQREALLKMQQKQRHQSEGNTGNATTNDAAELVVPTKRLTELFYSKLTPLLAKHNLKTTDSRKLWPLTVLRQVLNELIQETPSDLISKELWCHAINAAEWRKSVRRYTMSLAVMSVIGYVIGLGDRHLDNVLINLASGDIVHIDYNVCFEKGKTLRIPEKVPFRLTQNLVEALGITGIEGTFRLGCEYVLKAMRKERETLLTLLEAFVYDPLVDWTIGEDGITNRRTNAAKTVSLNFSTSSASIGKDYDHHDINKPFDWEQTRQMVSVRLGEVKSCWKQYSIEINNTLDALPAYLQEYLNLSSNLSILKEKSDQLHEQKALVHEISLNNCNHVFSTAAQRYAAKKQDASALHEVHQIVQSEYAHVNHILSMYYHCIQNVETMSDLNMQLIKQKLQQNDWQREYQLVAEVLQHSTLPLINYGNRRTEIDTMLQRTVDTALECVEQLQQYVSIMRFYPSERLNNNALVIFEKSYREYVAQYCAADDVQINAHANNFDSISCTDFMPMQCNENETQNVGVASCQVLEAASVMEQVWLELNCELHQISYQICNEKPQCLPVDMATKAIKNYRAKLNVQQLPRLYSAFAQVFHKSYSAFNEFEKTLFNEEDTNLLTQQLNYVNVLVNMLNSIGLDRHISELKGMQYILELQKALAALVDLKNSFQTELPEYLYRLFLIGNNNDALSWFASLSAQQLYMHCQNITDLDNSDDSSRSDVTTEFCTFLNTVCVTHFERLKSHLLKSYIVYIMHPSTSNVIISDPSDLDVLTMFNVVHQCLSIAGNYDIRSFTGIIMNYILYIERNYLIGLIGVLTHNFYVELISWSNVSSAKNNNVTTLPEAIVLCENLFMSLQQNSVITQQQQQMLCLNKMIKLLTVAATAHYWANEDVLNENYYGHIIRKDKLIEAIHQNVCTLHTLMEAIENLQSKLNTHVAEIQKERTNWNRNHVDGFMRSEETQQQLSELNINLIKQVANYANAVRVMEHGVLQYDISSDTAQGKNCSILMDDYIERRRLCKIQQWNTAYTRWQQSSTAITPIEESLVKLLPDMSVNNYWLEEMYELLDEQTASIDSEIFALNNEMSSISHEIYSMSKKLDHIYDSANCGSIRKLLNIVLKSERNALNAPSDLCTLTKILRNARTFMRNYRAKFNELRQILDKWYLYLTDNSVNADDICRFLSELNTLHQYVDNQELDGYFNASEEYLLRLDETKTLVSASSVPNKALNPCEQKRNAYGVSVWKKIRMKLEGREPDPSRRISINEQVDYIIKEATNVDNLAVLFEGWTPWV